jgi:hypothetical protein
MPISHVLSSYKALKRIEAEDRLGFIADVSMLFAEKKDKGHIQDLIKIANDRPETLKIDDGDGNSVEATEFVPGKTYVLG